MKKYLLLIAFSTVFLTFKSFGQVYEKIYSLSSSEVQNHMNQNKVAGIDILTGVRAHHVIGLTGVGVSQKSALETLLTNDSRVISFVLSEDGTSLVLESQARLTKEEFETLLQPLNGLVIGYAVEYSI
jgi:NO-binding membrane sensor protein with MHYT domain